MKRTSKRKRRSRRLRPENKPIGAAPGSLFVPEGMAPPTLALVAIGADDVLERDITELDEIDALDRRRYPLCWLDIVSCDAALLEGLGARFGLHRLALEDVASGLQRPKIEPFDEHHFAVLRHFYADAQHALLSEQVSVFFGRAGGQAFVISVREQVTDCFAPVRQRIRGGRGRLRSGDAAYLAYALLDTVVDGYFPLLERYGERIDLLEDAILEHFSPQQLGPARELRRELALLRRYLAPARDALAALARDDARVPAVDRPFFRDSHDHAVQLLEALEGLREQASSLLPLYASSVGNRAAEISRVLTMVATVFIPLSFIAGLYGMNFDQKSPYNMPELRWAFGYPAVIGLMAVVVLALLVYFHRKGWIGGAKRAAQAMEAAMHSSPSGAPPPSPAHSPELPPR
jgi:magnesium transporter